MPCKEEFDKVKCQGNGVSFVVYQCTNVPLYHFENRLYRKTENILILYIIYYNI